MSKKIILVLISILFLLSPIIALAGNCDEGQVIPNTAKCIDTDNGKNYGTYGVCKDSNNWDKEFKDYCEAGTLTEYYCSPVGTCMPTGRICENGCIQSSPSCRPDGTAITYPHNGCDDLDEGKFYYIKSICTDGLHSGATAKEHPDTCDGDFLKEWYCSMSSDATSLHSTCPITEDSFSHCTLEGTHCAFGCKNGACLKPNFGITTPVQNSGSDNGGNLEDQTTIKCCLNPDSDVCTATTVKNCCPDNGNYNLPHGPNNQKDCANNFFKSGTSASAPCLGLSDGSCNQACCCVKTYDDNGKPIIKANLDEYKINCQGKDKIFTNEGCSKARCTSLFSSNNDGSTTNPDTTNPDTAGTTNTDNEDITQGYEEICESGQCVNGTFCLKDFDKNEKRCCNEGQCLAQGVCFDSKTKLHRYGKLFICDDSKWQPVESYAKLTLTETSCENMNGTCRGGFLSFRKLTSFLRGGNFCNNGEYDYASCGRFGFFNVEKRCCVKT